MSIGIHPLYGHIHQTNGEFDDLLPVMYDAVLATSAQLILETGTNQGNSTRIWSEALKRTGGSVWSIDIDVPHGDVDRSNIHLIQGDSLEVAWDQPIDILFLDSDHTYNHVAKELTRFTPFIRPGGKLMLHDYLHEGTQKGSGRDIRKATEGWATPKGLAIQTFPRGCMIGKTLWGMGVVDIPQ